MLGLLFNFLGGPLLSKIVGGIVDSYKAKLDAQNTTEAHAIDLAKKEIEGEIQQRETEASIIRQEQGWWVTALPRPIMGLAASVLVTKLFVWDLALGEWTGGSTDKLSPQAWWLLTTIVIAYFGGRTIEKVARIFKR